MIDKITPEKLRGPHINYDTNHLTDAMAYAIHYAFSTLYVFNCNLCGASGFDTFKRLNCPKCGCNSNQFICKKNK